MILIDLNYTRDTTSGLEGLELLTRIRALNRDVPVIAMTAWGSIELAVDAMRTGLDDFIQKPWDNAHLLGHLRTHLQNGRVRRLQREARFTMRTSWKVRERSSGACCLGRSLRSQGWHSKRSGRRPETLAAISTMQRLPLRRHSGWALEMWRARAFRPHCSWPTSTRWFVRPRVHGLRRRRCAEASMTSCASGCVPVVS